MIVTCDSCQASFKVDDSRVPPDGIKVRCSKCKHVFMVKREVPEDVFAELEEFESFHRDQMEEEALGVEETVDSAAEQKGQIPEEPPAGISFEDFMAQEQPTPEAGEGEPSAEIPASEEFGEREEPLLDEGVFEEAAEGPGLEEFGRPEEPFQEEGVPEGIDSQLSVTPEPAELAEAPSEAAGPEMEETQLSVEAYFKEEMEQQAKEQEREASPASLKEKRFEDLVKEKGLEKRAVRRRSSSRAILILILLIMVGAAAYLWWQTQEAPFSLSTDIGATLKAAVGKVSDLWEDVIGFRKKSLELSGLQGYEDEIGQHRVYIIKGKVTNNSRRARRSVKLRVIILDQAGNRIQEKEVLCGNVFTREELEKLSSRFLTGEEILQPKRPKDMVVEAHQTISFMALFSGLPREGKSFKVEVLEAPGV